MEAESAERYQPHILVKEKRGHSPNTEPSRYSYGEL